MMRHPFFRSLTITTTLGLRLLMSSLHFNKHNMSSKKLFMTCHQYFLQNQSYYGYRFDDVRIKNRYTSVMIRTYGKQIQ